ncbi:MAG: DUF4956 domain-containing protein, partial [Bdellovibrionales bacterium]|nr:DUF4956 domain-containing protein [Bdellovibrionales bacterium]
FVMLATTTMLIISIVKSSLALSLGLVGALSIVRFRSAIKEPEELTFLFLCIALGLGFGAGQRLVTGLGFFLILIFIRMRVRSQIAHDNRDMSLIISSKSSEGLTLEQIHSVLQEFCVGVVLKRFDESNDALEAAYTVCFQNIESLQRCKTKFREMDQAISITFLDYSTT